MVSPWCELCYEMFNITQIAEKVEVDKGKPQPQGESVSLDLLLLFQRLLLSLLYSASTEGDKGSHLDVPRTSFAGYYAVNKALLMSQFYVVSKASFILIKSFTGNRAILHLRCYTKATLFI